MEVLGVVGRQIEDAVDTIVQAAVQDLPFPEESYKILHDHPGGVDLIIGTRRGKVVTIESAKSKRTFVASVTFGVWAFYDKTCFQAKSFLRGHFFHAVYRCSLHLPTGPTSTTSPCGGDPKGGGEEARRELEEVRQSSSTP